MKTLTDANSQGVPALFRWLSRKYPKIVARVIEDTPSRVQSSDGELVDVPLRYENPNPNGFEVDNLYLDMNGIVHPCTHPEGKPAPETEEDMMVEIFKYTERVVNMAKPRKVLMMAIDGVAPRAKMNQQRSRRFRAAQEAVEKEEERREAIRLFEAMGHPVSAETRNQKSWDTNAITPGTPFMDLLSISLKYWISYKLTNDPGWKDLKIIISDSSVPGEGEHKIMDWIRRQRTHPGWDANTNHVIYGLDADLIMLSLATHEPHFRVLREDVFFQGSKDPQVCKNCGEPGHFAANCKGDKKIADPTVVIKAKPVDPKPFIFLDVACLREYLAVELNVTHQPFPFDLELAIDDWIFMIFFVGNDFLPHLPSLEIREGAIDALLKIWRSELPRMGGYLTNHGKVNLDRAGVILEGLAKSEDEIFAKRREDEERQDHNSKRRRIEDHRRQDEAKAAKESGRSATPAQGSMQLNGQEYVAVTPAATARGGPLHPSLPTRPGFDLVPKVDLEKQTNGNASLGGSAPDKTAKNANLTAAQLLKAELEGDDTSPEDATEVKEGPKSDTTAKEPSANPEDDGEPVVPSEDVEVEAEAVAGAEDEDVAEDVDEDTPVEEKLSKRQRRLLRKRKRDEAGLDEEEDDDDDDELEAPPNPEDDQPVPKKKLKVNTDGTVDGYVDDVRLWEPGYRERYYRQKFGVELSDTEFIDQITKHYMEGLCWVLEYYYQGVPAWDWYYPYHYAPFAQDFHDVGKMKIEFKVAEPFKPFAQLLGVFPAASRKHLPEPLQGLMTDPMSPIIDFYPEDFDIDMNGKKMAWQGVALLPFIDQTRLLTALKSHEDELTDEEKRRNRWGDNVMFIAEENKLYTDLAGLYTLKAGQKPIPLDPVASKGITGAVMADTNCVPHSALDSPLPNIPECPDLTNNISISVRYYFPRQAHPHVSRLLRGFRPPPPVLTEGDKDWVRRGGQGAGGRDRRNGPGTGGQSQRNGSQSVQNGRPRNPSGTYTPQGGYGSNGTYTPQPLPSGYGVYNGQSGTTAGYGGYGGYGGYEGQNPYSGTYGGAGTYARPQQAYGGYAPPPPRNPYAPPPNPYASLPPPPSYNAPYSKPPPAFPPYPPSSYQSRRY
ncbi:5'-3' exoribonuclease 2 [Tremella mesenterica]|uniref:5'-3' exoribonuclease n=1 Tax=Tremella mesenterica TaxID=5217 RepID=A0A4Q1BMC1_TREME|nr:5'-3' exoribonuclease 2 [Tremella mesenterica]